MLYSQSALVLQTVFSNWLNNDTPSFSTNQWKVVRNKIIFCGLKNFKGTNDRQKTYEIFHVYCIFYSGFMCQTSVIFGITKDGSLVLNTLTS